MPLMYRMRWGLAQMRVYRYAGCLPSTDATVAEAFRSYSPLCTANEIYVWTIALPSNPAYANGWPPKMTTALNSERHRTLEGVVVLVLLILDRTRLDADLRGLVELAGLKALDLHRS